MAKKPAVQPQVTHKLDAKSVTLSMALPKAIDINAKGDNSGCVYHVPKTVIELGNGLRAQVMLYTNVKAYLESQDPNASKIAELKAMRASFVAEVDAQIKALRGE